MTSHIATAILAGGEGRRLGGTDKALVTLGGERLIDRACTTLASHATSVAVCPRTAKPWAQALAEDRDVTILEDQPSPDRGPLGGIAAALLWATSLTPVPDWVVTLPVDVPFPPQDLVARLTEYDADVAVAVSAGRNHHTVAAWRPHLVDALLEAIESEALAVRKFQSGVDSVEIKWATSDFDPFMNINTPEDLELAEAIVSR